MCEMMPHKFTDHIRDPLQNFVRINSYFDHTDISENEFSAYITDLTMMNLGEYRVVEVCCMCLFFSNWSRFPNYKTNQ